MICKYFLVLISLISILRGYYIFIKVFHIQSAKKGESNQVFCLLIASFGICEVFLAPSSTTLLGGCALDIGYLGSHCSRYFSKICSVKGETKEAACTLR